MEEGQSFVALVVGVTGMAGLSLAEALKQTSALGGPWRVYGAARRPKPSWFPDSIVDDFISFDALDSIDTRHKLSSLSSQVTHLFWVALQVRDTEEANIAVNSTMFSNVLNALTSSPSSRLRHVALQTGTKHYMDPTFDPLHENATQYLSELPFCEDSPRLPCPNFYYALEDIIASFEPAVTWSVHRPSIVIGASSRSIYNFLLGLVSYALICKYEGSPFRFPGNRYTWEHFCDVSDARVLAEQQIWASLTERAKNQAFNCTNGDVFTWKSMWKVLCETLEMEFVPFVPMEEMEKSNWAEQMNGKGEVWDSIVEENGLYKTELSEIACFEAMVAVMNLEFQLVCSMNKSREYGFFGCTDTLKSVKAWVNKLRQMNLIPKTSSS